MAYVEQAHKMARPSKLQAWIDSHPNRVPEIYGTFMALALIGYFLLSWMFGFVHIIFLRLLNFPILLVGIYYAIRQWRKMHNGIHYFKALVIGVSSSFIGVTIFTLFLFILFQLSPVLYEITLKNSPISVYMNTYMVTFAVGIEGGFGGFMATFLLINFMDTTDD